MRWICFLLLTAVITNVGCKKSSDHESLIGAWRQTEMQPAFEATRYHNVAFYGNYQYKMECYWFTDVVDVNEPCKSEKISYSKGVYHIDGGKIIFTGKLYNEDYETPTTDSCHLTDDFKIAIKYRFEKEKLVFFYDGNEYQRVILERY